MFTLYHHQEVALSYMRSFNYFGLFMDQGCGKTLPTVIRILELLKSGKIEDALIVAPKPVLGSWYRDFEKFETLDRLILEENTTLINYDITWRREDLKKHWGCIVLDESHYIKNRTSKRSKALLKMGFDSDYRYILTGTPISNGKLENIWSQFCFMDPMKVLKGNRSSLGSSILGGTYYDFLDRYCILNQYYQPCSYKYVNELQDLIAENSYRVKKSECLDLPEKLPDEIYEIEIKEKGLYKELHKFSTIEKYEVLAENPLSRMIKLRQVCSGFINTLDGVKDLKCEKINVLSDFLDGYEYKLVIFAQFTRSIDQISKLLKKKKLKHVILDGRQKNKYIWRDFQSNESIRVIVCQYDSGSTGIDLFSANTILYYEPTIVSTTLEQSRDRIHRTGQTQICSYIHFLTKGTIETQIYKALSEYSDFTESLFTEYMSTYQRKYDTTRG